MLVGRLSRAAAAGAGHLEGRAASADRAADRWRGVCDPAAARGAGAGAGVRQAEEARARQEADTEHSGGVGVVGVVAQLGACACAVGRGAGDAGPDGVLTPESTRAATSSLLFMYSMYLCIYVLVCSRVSLTMHTKCELICIPYLFRQLVKP